MDKVTTILEKYFSIESSFSYSENSVYLLQFHEEKDFEPYLIGYVIMIFSSGKLVNCQGYHDSYKAGLSYFDHVLDLSSYTAGWNLELKNNLDIRFDALDEFFVQHLDFLDIIDYLFECKEDDLHACNTLRLCQV